MSRFVAFARTCLLIAVVAQTAGCGGGQGGADVTGKVLFKGQPIVGARVTLVATDGKKYSAVTGKDGKFAIAKVDSEGELMVGIEGPTKVLSPMESMMKNNPAMAEKMKQTKGEASAADAGPYSKAADTGPEIPKKYADPQTSKLTWTLGKDKASRNKDFDLTD